MMLKLEAYKNISILHRDLMSLLGAILSEFQMNLTLPKSWWWGYPVAKTAWSSWIQN